MTRQLNEVIVHAFDWLTTQIQRELDKDTGHKDSFSFKDKTKTNIKKEQCHKIAQQKKHIDKISLTFIFRSWYNKNTVL